MVSGADESYIRIEGIVYYLTKLVRDEGNTYWIEKFRKDSGAVIHLAVIVEPYLSRILSGKKTIESRYSINMITPYRKIKTGDIVLLKKSGGEVVAMFEAGKVRYFSINGQIPLAKIREKYNDRLVIDGPFWEEKKNCKYATLIDINELLPLPKFKVNKRNRTAWMTLGPVSRQEEVQMKLGNYPHVICIVGNIASGKTYVSKIIANKNDWVRCSTADYLRDIAQKNGESFPSREKLQELGECEIKKGWNTFAWNFLDYAIAEKNIDFLIIDGIRHIEFYNTIKNAVYPQKCLLIYLAVPNEILEKRLLERGETRIDFNHISEGDQQSLFDSADFISNGDIDNIERFITTRFNLN